MEDRAKNLRLTIEGCHRLLLEEWTFPQNLEALHRLLAAVEAELAGIEDQRKEMTRVEEHSDAFRYAASNKPGTHHERISARTAANQTIGVEIAREVQRRELHARYRRGKISFAKFKHQLRRLRTREP